MIEIPVCRFCDQPIHKRRHLGTTRVIWVHERGRLCWKDKLLVATPWMRNPRGMWV